MERQGDLFQHCLGVGQGIFLSSYHLEICCILEETNLTRKLKVCGPKINRNRKAAQGRTLVCDVSVSLGVRRCKNFSL